MNRGKKKKKKESQRVYFFFCGCFVLPLLLQSQLIRTCARGGRQIPAKVRCCLLDGELRPASRALTLLIGCERCS